MVKARHSLAHGWINSPDQSGKLLHKLIAREIKNPINPHGWVHYYWNRPYGLFWNGNPHAILR